MLSLICPLPILSLLFDLASEYIQRCATCVLVSCSRKCFQLVHCWKDAYCVCCAVRNILSYPTLPGLPCRTFCRVLPSCPLPRNILSSPVMPHPALPCPVMPFPTLLYPVLSCPALCRAVSRPAIEAIDPLLLRVCVPDWSVSQFVAAARTCDGVCPHEGDLPHVRVSRVSPRAGSRISYCRRLQVCAISCSTLCHCREGGLF